jgi:hypothetical protein
MLFRRLVAACLAAGLISGTVLAQAAGSAAPRVRVTSAGQRISGRLVAVDANDVTIRRDGRLDPIRIPLSSLTMAEVSRGRRSRGPAWALGVAVGVIAGVGSAILIGLSNRDRGICAGCAQMMVVGPAVGVGSGLMTVHVLRSERWQSVPLVSLASLVARATP